MTFPYKHIVALFGSFVLILLVSASLFKTQAQSPTKPSLTCEVSIYKTQANSLPVGSQRTLVSKGEALNLDSRYLYTFNVTSENQGTDHIRSISVTPMAGSQEPISILQVRSIAGPCTISSDKRVNCSVAYQYYQTANEPIELLVSPYYDSNHPYTSINFFVQTDQGQASCFSNNQLIIPTMTTPAPNVLPAVQNLHVAGYRSVLNTVYKEAVLRWSPVTGALRYEIMSIGSTENSIGGTSSTEYTIRFNPTSNWYIAIYAQDYTYTRGEISDTVTVEYPGVDSLPPVPDYYSTPSPTPFQPPLQTPYPSSPPTPIASPFDSSKLAILEQKIKTLENTQQSQEVRLSILETIVLRIKEFFSRFFGR